MDSRVIGGQYLEGKQTELIEALNEWVQKFQAGDKLQIEAESVCLPAHGAFITYIRAGVRRNLPESAVITKPSNLSYNHLNGVVRHFNARKYEAEQPINLANLDKSDIDQESVKKPKKRKRI